MCPRGHVFWVSASFEDAAAPRHVLDPPKKSPNPLKGDFCQPGTGCLNPAPFLQEEELGFAHPGPY